MSVHIKEMLINVLLEIRLKCAFNTYRNYISNIISDILFWMISSSPSYKLLIIMSFDDYSLK